MGYTKGTTVRRRRARVNQQERIAYERAAAACHFNGSVTPAAKMLPSEELAPVTDATFDHAHAKVGAEDGVAVTAVAQCAIKARTAHLTAEGDEAWRPDLKCDVHALITVIFSKTGTSALGPDGLRFENFQSLPTTAGRKSKFPGVIRLFWRHAVEGPNASPHEFWPLLLQSNLTAVG